MPHGVSLSNQNRWNRNPKPLYDDVLKSHYLLLDGNSIWKICMQFVPLVVIKSNFCRFNTWGYIWGDEATDQAGSASYTPTVARC